MSDRVQSLLDDLEPDTRTLTALVAARWNVLCDPLGARLLVPVDEAADPLPVDELPWGTVVAEFTAEVGRPPRPGARALAHRRLTEPRHIRGGQSG